MGGTLGSYCPSKRLITLVAHSLRERILSHEEPDALIGLVRVCGGLGEQSPSLPGRYLSRRIRAANAFPVVPTGARW